MGRTFFDADKAPSLHELLKFKVNDKVYEVEEVTDELIRRVTELADGIDEEEISKAGLSGILRDQLALFTGKAPEEFDGVSIRVLTGVLDWIQEQVRDPRGRSKAKNLRNG